MIKLTAAFVAGVLSGLVFAVWWSDYDEPEPAEYL